MTDLPAKTAFTDADVTEGAFKTALNNLRDYLAERVQGLTSNTALSDADATLTAAQLVGGEFTITPTADRTQTTDTAANIITALAGSADGSTFEFTVINLGAFDVTIALGTDVTLVGNMDVNSGSATFRVRRLTSTTVSVTRLESQVTSALVRALVEAATDSNAFTDADHTKLNSLGAQNVKLNTKVIDIGDWDMDSTFEIDVVHGLTLAKIRSMTVLIRNDADTSYTNIDGGVATGGITGIGADSTEITLSRTNSGSYDTSFYSSTSYNRGWITIQYTD
jgi:hypothetical protein